MSAKENPCKKFQANIFNKSKCQNCFKPRESHLLSDEDLNQAKPIYGGWLLLAPEGTDFDNPMHRSRKWQRRFFILYEQGLLRYALDEMPTTLPQGTINMNQCTDVIDGESRTGQKFSLCILTPEEHFIRAENKEIINGWLEMLIVYPKTNKQNQKKKRKVEPPTPQEPGPAKMAATSTGIPSAEKIPATKSTLWQEEAKDKHVQDSSSGTSSGSSSPHQSPVPMPSSPCEPMPESKVDGGLVNGDRVDGGRKTRVESGYFSLEKTKDLKTEEQPLQTPPSPSNPDAPSRYSGPNSLIVDQDPFSPPGNWQHQHTELEQNEGYSHSPLFVANRQYAILADVPRARRISHKDAFQVEKKRLEQKTRARSPGREEVARLFGQQRRRSVVIEKFEALDIEKAEHMETNCSTVPSSEVRQGRSEKRSFPRKRDESGVSTLPDVSASHMSPYRRAKSLDRRSSESSMTPDLLNFKKGWLTKQYQDGQWKKHWFVLTDQTLRYYRDSVAEEAADLDGEIDLSACHDVTEYPVQRNYGFQIHTKEGEFTLSAMTSGIRRNWIQTIIKHVRPNTAPDVTSSLPEEKNKTSSSFSASSVPNDKLDSEHSDADVEQKRSRARERRREGRSKTFDWAEFRPIQQALAQERAQAAQAMKSISSYDTTDSKSDLGELERERARRREERRKRFESTDSVEESTGEDGSRMEIDRGPLTSENVDIRANVQVEIEQRWQQVETTPLREEKQIPISPLPIGSPKHSSEDTIVLLEKQLEQSQKEVNDLLAENLLLQQRLKQAMEQQQNARDGYVLQTELADPSSDAWQRLHKVNEDLQTELEGQCRRQELLNNQMQTLKHSYSEAKDSIRHHEAEIVGLHARINSLSAELSIKEETLTKVKIDLKNEKEKTKEVLEEWQSNEAALSSQLRINQQKLKDAESFLLMKSQELRELEMEQALQRDFQKETQRLQEKVADLSSQLEASEQSRIRTEERLQMNYEELLASYETEKQLLLHSLKEAEDKLVDYEYKLQENEQLMENLQKEKLNTNSETSILVHHLEGQLAGKESKIQKLEGYVREVEGERDQLKSACQKMASQMAMNDTNSANLQANLQMRDAECQNLRNSLEKASKELVKFKESMREKEEENRCILETHRKTVEKKDQDINEAMIKMAALGNSLEETETKLKAKEEALLKVYNFNIESQTKEIEMLRIQLEGAKNQIAEFEKNLQSHRGDTFGEEQGMARVMETGQDLQGCSSSNTVETCAGMFATEREDTGAKRQRIRFSSIQCQKYIHGDGGEKTWTSSNSSDSSQEQCVSEEGALSVSVTQDLSSGPSDIDGYLSIIHSLESQLCVNEEKLKDLTLQLENEKNCNQEALLDLHNQWSRTESSLREELQNRITQINTMAKQLETENITRLELERWPCTGFQKDVLNCIEACRKLHQDLPFQGVTTGPFSSTLPSCQSSLMNTIHSLEKLLRYKISSEGCSTAIQCEDISSPTEIQSESHKDTLQNLAEKIDFQAKLVNNLASAVMQARSESSQASHELKPDSEDFSSMSLVEVFTKKVMLLRDYSRMLEGFSKAIVSYANESPINPSPVQDLFQTLSDNTLIKAELDLATQKLDFCRGHVKILEAELKKANPTLDQRSLLERGTIFYEQLGVEHCVYQRIPPCHLSTSEPCDDSQLVGQSCPSRLQGSMGDSVMPFEEELAKHLREHADTLKGISSAFMSMQNTEIHSNMQSFLEVSKQLSCCEKILDPCNVFSVLVQDAVVQAQIQYVTCKTRLEYEREMKMLVDRLCHLHSEALEKVQQECQVLVQNKQDELSDMIKRERAASEAIVNQATEIEKHLGEAEASFKEKLSLVESSYEREIQSLMESWAERENILKAEQGKALNKFETSELEKQNSERHYVEQIRILEAKFQDKILELNDLHRDEIMALENRYTHSIQQLQETLDIYQREHPDILSLEEEPSTSRWLVTDSGASEATKSTNLRDRVLELETQIDMMREQLERKHQDGNASALKEKYQADFENLKATCERGFAAMEETHQKKIEDLQRQHQRELEKLRDEKDRLLAEETAATISAIEAMKNAHREELERELEKTHRSQISSVNADVESLRRQYLEELNSIQRELEVLSEQYSQKCLENAHLAQALEAERQALRQCQRENQELNAHNQELNNRLATEITRLRALVTGDGRGELSPLTQGKDSYELEVLLRVKESEIQYQKQEISSLKDELHTALRDKKYMSDKYKDIYTELSNAKAKAECDISRLKDQLKTATEMLGDKTPENPSVSGYDIMKSKSNPDFLKNDRSSINRQLRNIRSKSVIEQVSWDN
ncbi:myosin phosphatase Rho-interacting protein isoform X2 [Pelobates fuscus]|uniref:myosin phosphatase Rho-interacting protein isoform X2 n=1 Tax=Pelobates fuscus TaxID=191477 RepID=UPI002FE4A663